MKGLLGEKSFHHCSQPFFSVQLGLFYWFALPIFSGLVDGWLCCDISAALCWIWAIRLEKNTPSPPFALSMRWFNASSPNSHAHKVASIVEGNSWQITHSERHMLLARTNRSPINIRPQVELPVLFCAIMQYINGSVWCLCAWFNGIVLCSPDASDRPWNNTTWWQETLCFEKSICRR